MFCSEQKKGKTVSCQNILKQANDVAQIVFTGSFTFSIFLLKIHFGSIPGKTTFSQLVLKIHTKDPILEDILSASIYATLIFKHYD